VLRRRDHDVTVVGTVDEAWTRVQDDPPEMVVLEAEEPKALDLGVGVQEARPETLLVFFCTDRSSSHLHTVFEAGADDCIFATDDTDRLDRRFAFIEQYLASPPPRLERATDGPRARRQAVVAEIGRRALAGTEREVLMAYATRAVAGALEVEHCKVLKHLPNRHQFLLKAGTGWSDGLIGTTCISDDAGSQAGFTLQCDGPVVVDDLASEDRFDPPQLLVDHEIRAGISVVIPSTPEPYGVLGAHTTDAGREFGEDDVYFLQSVANVLAGAVERSRTEQALRESEAKARAIVETTVDGIITIDDRGRIQSFNEAAEDIFGYDEEEVTGENVKMLMPPPYREEHDGYIRSYHETGRRRIIGIGREVTGKRKDGSTFPMDLAVSEVKLGDRHMFTGIVRDISERRQLEKEILNISEQERRRIGQDLHDGLGQMLTGIGLLGQNVARQLKAEDHDLADDVAEITELVKEADQYARDLARGLTPVDVDATGLSQALQRLADNAVRLFDVPCAFEEVGTALVHDSTTATHLYRIAQEAVSNAVRHGDATRLKILLASGTDQIRLRVQDDGVGFDAESVDGPGMGVNIMNYRARIIGGTLEITSDVGEGTVVTCTLPRTEVSANADAEHSVNGGAGAEFDLPDDVHGDVPDDVHNAE
jgi:PAS domain S-box-containing protein